MGTIIIPPALQHPIEGAEGWTTGLIGKSMDVCRPGDGLGRIPGRLPSGLTAPQRSNLVPLASAPEEEPGDGLPVLSLCLLGILSQVGGATGGGVGLFPTPLLGLFPSQELAHPSFPTLLTSLMV